MSRFRKRILQFTLSGDGLLAVSALAWLLGATYLPPVLTQCWFHTLCRLYCPACGGTRALKALLTFHPLTALKCYPPLFLFLFLWVELHFRLWLSYQKEELSPLQRFPKWHWITALASIAVWFAIRNLLLVYIGIDLTGDFLP